MTTPARRHNLRRRAQVDIPRTVDLASKRVLTAWERAYNLIAADLERDARIAAQRGPLSASDFRTGRLGASVDAAARGLSSAAAESSATVRGAAPAVARGSVEVQESYLFGRTAGAAISVNQLDPARLRTVVERTTEQIASRYIVLSRDAERSLRDNLIRGVARGAGPRDVARRIVDETRGVFGGGSARALNLARTELIDLSRRASAETYAANPGLVTGWRWSAALDTRTCPACWAMHNTLHDPDEVLEGHQSCRCVPVPALALDDDGDDLGDPAALFRRLPRAQQLEIMGPGRLEALDNGLPFRDLVQRRANPGWRPGHYVRPVQALGTPRLDASDLTTRVDAGVPRVLPPAPQPQPGASKRDLIVEGRTVVEFTHRDSRLYGVVDAITGDSVDVYNARHVDGGEVFGAVTVRISRVKIREQGTPVAAPVVDEDAAGLVAQRFAADSEVDPSDLAAVRDEFEALRTTEWLRLVEETGEDVDLDLFLAPAIDVDRLPPAAREWVRTNPQPTLGQYGEALDRRAAALTPRLDEADVDEWADAWGGVEASLPRRARASSVDAEYAAYREALWLEAVEATNARLVKRDAPADALGKVEAWLLKGGRMPPVRYMSEELQEHLGVGEFGTSRSTPFLSKTEWRRQRDRRPDDLDDTPAPPASAPEPDPFEGLLDDEAQVEALLNDVLPARLTGARLEAVQKYQQSYYRYLNEALRSDADGDLLTRLAMRNRNADDLFAMHRNLLEVLDDVRPLDRPVQVFRGSRSLPDGWDGQPGATFTDRGWSSTSTNAATSRTYAGRSGVMMEVEIPRGARVLPVDKATLGEIDRYGEHEFVLPPGARYVVVSAEQRDGMTYMRVRLVP